MSANTITDTNTAKAVLAAAKENAVWEAPIPSDEDQLLKDANFVYDQAVTAWNNKMRGDAVTAVKFAAEVNGAHEDKEVESEYNPSEWKVVEVVEAIVKHEKEGRYDLIREIRSVDTRKTVKRAADAALESEDNAYAEPDENGEVESDESGEVVSPWTSTTEVKELPTEKPKSKFNELFEAEEFARAEAKKLNLPVPERVDDIPAATLSRGVANLTVQELAERLTDASLCLAAATWQTALAEIDEEHSERVGNHYFNIEYQKAAPDAKNVQAATAKAEQVEEVKRWRDAQAEAHSRYLAFRALKEVYKGTYDTISRVFAMKQEANERHR